MYLFICLCEIMQNLVNRKLKLLGHHSNFHDYVTYGLIDWDGYQLVDFMDEKLMVKNTEMSKTHLRQ